MVNPPHSRTFSQVVLPRPQGIPSTVSHRCPRRGPPLACATSGSDLPNALPHTRPPLPTGFPLLGLLPEHFQLEQKGLPCFPRSTLPETGCNLPRPLGSPSDGYPLIPHGVHLAPHSPSWLLSVACGPLSCDSSSPGAPSGSGRAQGQVWDMRLAQTPGSGGSRCHLPSHAGQTRMWQVLGLGLPVPPPGMRNPMLRKPRQAQPSLKS